MACPHIDSELEKKDFLRKLTLGVNWGIYTLHGAPSKVDEIATLELTC